MLGQPVLKAPGLTLRVPIALSPSAGTLRPSGARSLRTISSPFSFLCHFGHLSGQWELPLDVPILAQPVSIQPRMLYIPKETSFSPLASCFFNDLVHTLYQNAGHSPNLGIST